MNNYSLHKKVLESEQDLKNHENRNSAWKHDPSHLKSTPDTGAQEINDVNIILKTTTSTAVTTWRRKLLLTAVYTLIVIVTKMTDALNDVVRAGRGSVGHHAAVLHGPPPSHVLSLPLPSSCLYRTIKYVHLVIWLQ